MDVTRLALELEAELLPQVELEAEVEFEHGGTGGALELEYEEFGEFEQEVEKGGEVILEELYVKRSFGEHLHLSAGHFYVAVGLLSDLYRPLDYYGTVRPESEAAVIPALWHETGIEASGRVRQWRWRLQVINGLDATGVQLPELGRRGAPAAFRAGPGGPSRPGGPSGLRARPGRAGGRLPLPRR